MRLHKIFLVALVCLLSVSVGSVWAEDAKVPKTLPANLVGEIVYAVREWGRDGHWYANLGYFMVHVPLPGKACLIFRKKYSSSR